MTAAARPPSPAHAVGAPPPLQSPAQSSIQTPAPLSTWLGVQALNVTRHTAALRPFTAAEFGTGASAPTEGHVQAVNTLLDRLRRPLQQEARRVAQATAQARAQPAAAALARVTTLKERAHDLVRAAEKVWDFYFELFGQRQARFADWLLACDRVALDCYQDAYVNLGRARSIPAPPPFSYMRTGFSPATYRRGLRLKALGRVPNPFPLIQLPYHRLINPWTLGAVLHEVSHNLQSDLGLSGDVPREVGRALLAAGAPPTVAATWVSWNREAFADLSGLLLGGPSVVASLMDVVGRSPPATTAFSPGAPHPTPYLRVLLSCAALSRMGFPREAQGYARAWTRLYPAPRPGVPAELLRDLPGVLQVVVRAMCDHPYPSLGGKALSQLYAFTPQHQAMVEEAAARLARGVDPGVVPERFLIGAVRVALERRLADPETLKQQFYRELARR